jgi:hypothetical protein
MGLLESIAAAAGITEAVAAIGSKLYGARSVVVEVYNWTDERLALVSHEHMHGGFAEPPDQEVSSQSVEIFGSQSKGFATGTEGKVTYEGPGFTVVLYWDNPFIGSNQSNAWLSGPAADRYRVTHIPGSGNERARMKFELAVIS